MSIYVKSAVYAAIGFGWVTAAAADGPAATEESPKKAERPDQNAEPGPSTVGPNAPLPAPPNSADPAPPNSADPAPPNSSDPALSEADQLLLDQALQSGETILVEGDDSVQPGSAHTIDKEALERFESDDIHRVLRTVPGVYMREEDGYGLRPNIGIRGSGSERSAKIALLEDGVLIAPAPYSAPAAYYFPLVTRMQRVEVVKGAVAVRHGPNTVGGAINLVGNGIPLERVASVDLATGNNLYGKMHLQIGDVGKHWGAWVEGVKLHSDGFKILDNGGDTGFDKNDVIARFRVNSDPSHAFYNQLTLSVGYSDEVSNETYTGLSDDDFDLTPNRRYSATQLDRMDWTHSQFSLKHELELGTSWDLDTTLYHHLFRRDWRKLTGFTGGRALEDVLAAPDMGLNAIYYQVLTGQADTASDAERIELGTNARDFVSQGLQTVLHSERTTGEVVHDLSFGVRLHLDKANRKTLRDTYSMMSGALVRDDSDTFLDQDATGEARAWAIFAQDSLQWRALTVTGGFRAEAVSTSWKDHLNPEADQTDFFSVLIPGAGAFYALTKHAGLLAGVHRGFVPVAPGQDPNIDPETSTNYEAGVRYGNHLIRAEVIGFLNDFQNLKATCSFSAGCTPNMAATEFNGYGALVGGVEAMATGELRLSKLAAGLSAPLTASYTFNRTRFKESFSSENPQWGDVEKGDELPYLARHNFAVEAGLRKGKYEIASAVRYLSEMRDVAGQGPIAEEERIGANVVIDLSLHAQFGRWGHLYGTVDNVLGTRYVVSRRPMGLRPGKPRIVILGYKNTF
jgi:Fe(3+) dicitrate transport protein